MVRVVGKEGALGAGVGGNCSSGMDGSKMITKRHAGRRSVYYSVGRISILLGGTFKQVKASIISLKTLSYYLVGGLPIEQYNKW